MNILLIRPQNSPNMKLFNKAHGATIPLGLAYIAAFLRQNNINDISILDNHVEGLGSTEIKDYIQSNNPNIVGIYTTTPTILIALEIAKIVKSVERDTIVVMGGPHVTALPEESLKDENVDIIVIGEGEVTMLKLIEALEGKKSFSQVKGISYRENGRIKFTRNRPLIRNLDSIPFPSRDLLEMNKYFLASSRKKVTGNSDIVISGRGCPYDCIFCSNAVFGRKTRYRSASNIVEEIELLIDRYSVREIVFQDDAFTTNKRLAWDICELIIEKKINISWNCQSRADNISEDLAKLFKAAGCKQIAFGIETGSQKIMDLISKGITLEQAERAIKLCKKYGIGTQCAFIIGLPGDTRESAIETINFAKKLNPDLVVFNILVPVAGAKIFEMAQEKNLINREDYTKYVSLSNQKPPVLMSELTADELVELQKKAFKEFYFRPLYISRRLMNLRSIEEIKQGFYGVYTLLRHQIKKYTK